MQHPRHVAGFSLIELLVVTVILLVLYALAWGPTKRHLQERRKAECAARMGQLYLALELYAHEHDGAYPNIPGASTSDQPLNGLVPQYTSDTQLFICPGESITLPQAASIAGHRISYAYYMGERSSGSDSFPLVSDSQLSTRAVKASGEKLFAEKQGWPGGNHPGLGGNILFTDGHTETTGLQLERALAPQSGAILLNPRQ